MGRSHLLRVLVAFFILVWTYSVKCANFSRNYTGKVYLHHPKNYTYNLTGDKSVRLVFRKFTGFSPWQFGLI